MIITLTRTKKTALKRLVNQILSIKSPKLRFLAKVIGTIVAAFPASKYGPLYYRCLEYDKSSALKENKGDYEAHSQLSDGSKQELLWWRLNIDSMYHWISPPLIHSVMHCDASAEGWGTDFLGQKAGGGWHPEEYDLHINPKELLAIYYAIKTFVEQLRHTHLKVFSDNTTAVGCITNMGSSKSSVCNRITKEIWELCIKYGVWLTCAHIPGIHNVEADTESRRNYEDAEWMLNPRIFHHACKVLPFHPDLDCFASRLNSQLAAYVSYRPDPFCTYVDAFTLTWKDFHPYLFPPFSLLPRVLQKAKIERVEAMIVAPFWPTQPWFTMLRQLLTVDIVIQPHATNLILPNKPHKTHPLASQLHLIIGVLSGENTSV